MTKKQLIPLAALALIVVSLVAFILIRAYNNKRSVESADSIRIDSLKNIAKQHGDSAASAEKKYHEAIAHYNNPDSAGRAKLGAEIRRRVEDSLRKRAAR